MGAQALPINDKVDQAMGEDHMYMKVSCLYVFSRRSGVDNCCHEWILHVAYPWHFVVQIAGFVLCSSDELCDSS